MNTAAKDKPANFDKLARAYRWMEYLSFGPLLMRCRLQFLSQMANAQRGLILGDGNGRFTAQLLRANPVIQLNAVDASPAMLQALLHAAGKNAARVQIHCADLRTWQPQAVSYDLVASHFLLDCFSTGEVRQLVDRVTPNLLAGAQWVVSDFAIPEGSAQKIIAQLLVAFLYQAFRLLTGLSVNQLPDHASALEANGFKLEIVKIRCFGILRCELWKRVGNA